jgi:prophage regulatory protein
MTELLQALPVPAHPLRLIRLAEVKRRTGMSRSTIYRWMRADKFPRSHCIGGYIAAWSEAEIDAWIDAALADSRASY